MDAVKNLLKNEHSFAMLALIIGATVLAALDHMTTDQWTTFAQWIFGIYMGGHAVISAADSISNKTSLTMTQPSPEPVVEAPKP